MPRLARILDITEDVRERMYPVCLHQLQATSPLHTLVVTNASLEIVQLVYEFDKAQMNNDVFLDACRHTASPEVIAFLKELVTPDVYQDEAIAAEMIEILKDDQYFEGDAFSLLFPLFPKASWTPTGKDSKSPFSFACECTNIVESTMTKMIQTIPSSTESIKVPIEYIRQGYPNPCDSKHEDLRSALNTTIGKMTNLKHLTLPLCFGDLIDADLRQTVCGLLALGELESLTILKSRLSNGFFLPIFDAMAAAGSNSMVLRRFDLKLITRREVELYRDRMMEEGLCETQRNQCWTLLRS